MPTKLAVRLILPPKRLIWVSKYSRSNNSRASRSECVATLPDSTICPSLLSPTPVLLGSSSVSIKAFCDPMISTRSIIFFSWRILPGHTMLSSVVAASSLSVRLGRPSFSWNSAKKCSARKAISSRRSAKFGTTIGTTFRRWNSSSRKVPASISSTKFRAVAEITLISTFWATLPSTRVKL